jgi:hypothetical protein
MASTTPLTIDATNEDVLIAAQALGDMRRSAPSPTSSVHTETYSDGHSSHHATPSLVSLASTSTYSEINTIDVAAEQHTPGFGSRVSNFPLVRSAIGAYESSKASSRVVKYGAGLVESSVKTISRPVMDRLPLDQIDQFAGRQLDRLGSYRSGGNETPTPTADEGMQLDSAEDRSRTTRETTHLWREQTALKTQEPQSRATSVAPSEGYPEEEPDPQDPQQQQVVARSKWQAMLLEAGGLGAAVSEESMKRLKYCLQWLQYATAHIDQQIGVLRDFIASLNAALPDNPDAVISAAAMKTLTDIKKDVVETVRQVVEVVSKYAGGALPEPARATVRDFVLRLPDRWARASRATPVQPQTAAQSPRSAHASPYYRPTEITGNAAASPLVNSAILPTAASATLAAHRILTLATESLDMMRGVTGVFKDSLDRAEAWIERLRIIGIQRGQQDLSHELGAMPGSPGINDGLNSLSLAAAYASSNPTSPTNQAKFSVDGGDMDGAGDSVRNRKRQGGMDIDG